MLHFQVQLVNVDRLFSSRECAMWGADEGSIMVITHKISVDSPNSSITLPSISEQHTILQQLRHELLLQYRPILQQGAGPIRVMARMVAELERRCRELHITDKVMQNELVTRTTGRVHVALVNW